MIRCKFIILFKDNGAQIKI